jgi:hypothetical protein
MFRLGASFGVQEQAISCLYLVGESEVGIRTALYVSSCEVLGVFGLHVLLKRAR